MSTKHIQANGLRFAYEEEGTGPLVMLIHGFPDSPQTWDAVRPAVAQAGFRAVSPFTRGYTPTEIPKDDRYGGDTLGRVVRMPGGHFMHREHPARFIEELIPILKKSAP